MLDVVNREGTLLVTLASGNCLVSSSEVPLRICRYVMVYLWPMESRKKVTLVRAFECDVPTYELHCIHVVCTKDGVRGGGGYRVVCTDPCVCVGGGGDSIGHNCSIGSISRYILANKMCLLLGTPGTI